MVFDKHWFNKYQKSLVWLARTWIGSLIFQYRKMGHSVDRKRVVKITPNSVAELIGIQNNQVEIKEHFFSRNEYARKLYFMLLPVWYAMHFWDLIADRLSPQWSFGFDTLTQYPDAGTGSTTCDSSVSRNAVSEVWATIIAGAGNVTNPSAGDINAISFKADTVNNNWMKVYRSIFVFDTSALTFSANISSTVFSIYGDGFKNDGAGNTPDINVYGSTPGADNNIAASDYSQIGSTAYATAIAYADYNVNAYNDFTFNATGLSNVSKTGNTKLGCRNANHDVAGVAPTWVSGADHYINCFASDNGSNKPKLVVTYTLSSGFIPKIMIF